VQASHNKVWSDSVAILPSGAIDNNKIHIRNIRDFIYKTETDYQINYIKKTYKALVNFKWVSN
jgi:L-rhamnose mutarotase